MTLAVFESTSRPAEDKSSKEHPVRDFHAGEDLIHVGCASPDSVPKTLQTYKVVVSAHNVVGNFVNIPCESDEHTVERT